MVYGHMITTFSAMGRFTHPWRSAGARKSSAISLHLYISHPFPFDYNYICWRVTWDEKGPGYPPLTTATPYKSKKILFKARALGPNLL